LFLSKNHSVQFKVGLGEGKNMYVEFMALVFLIKCAMDKNIKHIWISKEYSLVINWMNGEIKLSNITQRPIDEQ
jgi:hypothetical protein